MIFLVMIDFNFAWIFKYQLSIAIKYLFGNECGCPSHISSHSDSPEETFRRHAYTQSHSKISTNFSLLKNIMMLIYWWQFWSPDDESRGSDFIERSAVDDNPEVVEKSKGHDHGPDHHDHHDPHDCRDHHLHHHRQCDHDNQKIVVKIKGDRCLHWLSSIVE